MAIALKNIGISVGYGLVDEFVEMQGFTVPQVGLSGEDALRFVVTFGSYLANMMGYFPSETEILFYSSAPLTTKSAVKLIMGAIPSSKRVVARAHRITVSPVSEAKQKQLEFIGIR